MRSRRVARAIAFAVLAFFPVAALSAEPAPADTTALGLLIDQAEKLKPLMRGPTTLRFLSAVPDLPSIAPRDVYYDRKGRRAMTVDAAAAKTETELEGYEKQSIDEQFYYNTRYGTPLAFARALDLVEAAGLGPVDGERILDFGFGSIGQLRLLASLGARVTGIEVDPLLEVLYSRPADTGTIAKSARGGAAQDGDLRLLFGSFPGDSAIAAAAGGGYRLVISKNTLKKGYIHPSRDVDPRMLVHLGVDDATFVSEVASRLEPGGLFMIYNLHPALSRDDEPYRPWSDGRCPFDRDLLEKSGFTVLAFDQDDTEFARRMGTALGWADQMNMETDLFGTYTLMRRD